MRQKDSNVLAEWISLRTRNSVNQNWQSLGISKFSLYQTNINSRECPHCCSHNVVSKGNYKERKRYQCKNCGKSYNDLTKTPFSGIHNLDKIKRYLDCLIRGESIRKAALEINVSITTSFNWRHRILNSLSKLPLPKMRNVKEIIELELPYSHKGQRSKISKTMVKSRVSAIFICDRIGKMDSDSIVHNKRENNPIFSRINKSSNTHSDFICSPKFKNIRKYLDIKVNTSNSVYKQPNMINQIVNIWEIWMKRFHGVATKYLSNYLHWFDFLDNTLFSSDKIPQFVQLLLQH